MSQAVGEIASVGAAVMWAGALCAFRAFGYGVHATTLNVFKNGLALVLCVLTWALLRPALPASQEQYVWLLVSGVIGFVVGDTTLFASLRLLGARLAALLQCLFAPVTVILGWVTLGEELRGLKLLGVIVTVTAVIGVLRLGKEQSRALEDLPRSQLLLGIFYGVVTALTLAVAMVIARPIMQDVGVVVGTAVRLFPAIVILGPYELWRGHRTGFTSLAFLRNPKQVAALAIATFFGTYLGVLLMTAGIKYAHTAGVAATLNATFPVWILPIAATFLGERTGVKEILLTVVAVFGVALVTLG